MKQTLHFISENWLKLLIIIISIQFLLVLETYLRDKNQINALTNRADCVIKSYNDAGIDNVCSDIESYKIKSENWY